MARRLHPISRDLAVLSRSGYPLIYVITREEDRARDLIEDAAQVGKKAYAEWSSARGFDAEATANVSGLSAGEAIRSIAASPSPTLFALLDFHPYLSDPAVVRRLREVLPLLVERKQSIVLVAPVLTLPPEIEKDTALIDLPLPKTEELKLVLEDVARTERIELEEDTAERALRSALGLSQNQAGRVFRKVMVLRKGLAQEDLKLIVEEKKQILRTTDTLEFHELDEDLENVGGLGELKRWLEERTAAFGEDARAFGLPPPKGLLLLGVQGCGKSLSAKAVANLWKFPLLRLDLGAVFAGGGGAPEAALRDAIKISESLAPVVLWVDEIEKGFSSVESGESSARVFGGFITWLAEKKAEVFVVATANNVEALPPELIRRGRFDEIFFVDLPNQHERLDILRIHLKKRRRDPKKYRSISEIAKAAEHFSGAELEQVVISALYNAFSKKRELSDEDLLQAARQVVPLYQTYEERIKALREWSRRRARPATLDSSVLDLFGVAP